MTLKNKNPWKYLSVGLLGVIAIGLVTPIDGAKPVDLHQTIVDAITTLQASVDTIDTSGLATQASVDATNAKVDILLGCNHDFEDLTGADFTGADLRDCSFRHADLSSADFTGADLSGADLTGADLGSPISGIETNAILLNADLTGATLGSFYIDTTFGSFETGSEEWHTNNYCVDGMTDNAIAILEDDADWQSGDPFVAPQTMGEFEGFSNTEVTVLTILCEDITP